MSQHLGHPAGVGRIPELLRTGFHIDLVRGEGVVLVRLAGELDMATAVGLRQGLMEAVTEGVAVIVDLTDLGFIDSTGIGVLVGGARRAHEAGCSFVVRSPSRSVHKALRLTGVDKLLRIEAPAHLN